MTEHRIFSKTIVESDTFLDMPLSAQALYFHLCLLAGKEGTLNKELEDFMESLYKKTVPTAVREFIEKKAGQAEKESQRPGKRTTTKNNRNTADEEMIDKVSPAEG